MHQLIIHNLGPIADCTIDCSRFMTFTGFQASGKSTIAKAVFYFRTIKDDIFQLVETQSFRNLFPKGEMNLELPLNKQLQRFLREKFLRTFGSSYSMDNSMSIEYIYSPEVSIRISLKDGIDDAPNYIWVDLGNSLTHFLKEHENCFSSTSFNSSAQEKIIFQSSLSALFADDCEVVYLPAGRSMLTLLSQQLNYIYSTMKDSQKKLLDYCTQNYIERILQLKPEFSHGLDGILWGSGAAPINSDTIAMSKALIQNVLRGQYLYTDTDERIVLSDKNNYVKINYASSGQQESLWILNLLFYYLVQRKPVLFIIEEPESNLFPESQKYITELIALVENCGHSVVITTHSPYVLGTLNNLIYAGQLPKAIEQRAESIIPKEFWIHSEDFAAFFVKNGCVENCIDEEIHLIQNERIDEISKSINSDFDCLFDLESLP